jgi:hypothetical protein
MNQKDYLTERIGARIEVSVFESVELVAKKFNLTNSEVLREIVHEAIRENYKVIKHGIELQKLGFDKI